MTIEGLETFVKTYVAAGKQAGAWVSSTDNLLKLQDKIGKVPSKTNYQNSLVTNCHWARPSRNG